MRFNIIACACCLAAMLCTGNARAADHTTLVGVSVGGVNMVGLYVEHRIDDEVVRAQIGNMIHAINLGVAYAHTFDTGSDIRPYVGIGLMKHMRKFSFHEDTLVSFPVGADIKLNGRNFMAAELVPALSISPAAHHRNEDRGLTDYVLPLPCIFYKHRVD